MVYFYVDCECGVGCCELGLVGFVVVLVMCGDECDVLVVFVMCE